MTGAKTPFVLIVEDDRDIAALFRHTLDLAGYRTEIVVNGKVAVEYLYKSPPDILLLDLSLPGLSGVEVLKKIKSEESMKKIHVVIVTGNPQIADSLPDSTDLVLLKPVSPDQLSALVGRLFQNDETMERRPFTKNPWDSITGLYNRHFFICRLECALENYKENTENLFGVIVVNPNHGKSGRTKLQKKQKEKIIQEIAKSLKAVMRPTDTIARFYGDHFYILVENLHNAGFLSMIADRIQLALDNHPAEGIRYSIEATLCNDGKIDIDDILMNVRTANTLANTEDKRGARLSAAKRQKM